MSDGKETHMYGVVVMGLGIAGRSRLRDLQKDFDNDILKKVKLRGFISRRDITEDSIPKFTLEEALEKDDVDLIIVATEPKLHEDSVRKVLEAGKHCLVDYPVALSSTVAKDLYALAKSKGVILHQENIGLLSPTIKYLKEEIAKRPPITDAQILLTGKYNGWIEDWENSGAPFTSGNGVVETAQVLFGHLEVDAASLQQEKDLYSFVGHIYMTDKRPLDIVLQRRRDGTRKHEYLIKFKDDSVIDKIPEHVTSTQKPGQIGLFMQDLILCMEEILGTRDPSEDIARTIRGLEIAEEIHANVGL